MVFGMSVLYKKLSIKRSVGADWLSDCHKFRISSHILAKIVTNGCVRSLSKREFRENPYSESHISLLYET